MKKEIHIQSAAENNLKGISLRIPHHRLVVVTGVSGSGKSSLVYGVIGREGQRLFLENFLEGHPLAGKKLRRPQGSVSGLYPVLTVNQRAVFRSPRSTVGTMTELYDYLRLLFARLGTSHQTLSRQDRSLFSFNTPAGQCPACQGLGVADRIDPELLISDKTKTLRQGALALTTPNGYIIYSQVTMEVLDQVCRSEGFSADIPWQDLTGGQQKIVLFGSDKLLIPFGKHPLESRMKWSGITARPRQEGHYKGIIPVMEEILKRDRNPNILRFARSFSCPACRGKRLNPEALSVSLWGMDIAGFAAMSIRQLAEYFERLEPGPSQSAVAAPVRELVLRRCGLLAELGLAYLTVDRGSATLSGGEAQRIKLANQAAAGLRNVLYVLDEPSAGLHPADHARLLGVVRTLVDNGNSVIAVEHDEQTIRAADWIIDLGPGPGLAGGELLFNGPCQDFIKANLPASRTWSCLKGIESFDHHVQPADGGEFFGMDKAARNNLKGFEARFKSGRFNVVTGVSGSGKSSLAEDLLETLAGQKAGGPDIFKRIIHVDQSPIGRTPNSNPATYTGMSDHIRDLFSSLPESRRRGYAKGQFSFVVKGGRCEACQGAGVQEIGMHFLGNVEIVCEACGGKRFSDQTLQVAHQGKNISEVLQMSIDEAHCFFEAEPKITTITRTLIGLGLGYLKLGQPSNTLSGGEAQRVKLAAHLAKPSAGKALYILDEPTTGLHLADVKVLAAALRGLTDKGHTVLAIEHHPDFILSADWVLDLGPGSGEEGGELIYSGPVSGLAGCRESITGRELKRHLARPPLSSASREPERTTVLPDEMRLRGVTTNNLKSVDLTVPLGQITAVTGVSGSGKSSLVFDTFYAESQRRFNEGLSPAIRQLMGKTGDARMETASGLTPSIAVRRRRAASNPRSTVGTYTGLHDLLRLLYSRAGGTALLSSAFSFNHEEGACQECRGLGTITACDPERLVTNPALPLTAGAMDGTKTGKFYGEPGGQHTAALRAAGRALNIDFDAPWNALSAEARSIAMHGLPVRELEVKWNYQRGRRTGVHHFKGLWKGFAGLVDIEYQRKHADRRGAAMLGLMSQQTCPACAGKRLKAEPLAVKLAGRDIAEMTALPIDSLLRMFCQELPALPPFLQPKEKGILNSIGGEIIARLRPMAGAGLGYIAADRLVSTLSGGEFQRLQLSSQIRSGLTGVTYVLDEPSFGLHPADAARISGLVTGLKDDGNTILLVEQSKAMLAVSDQVIELGPAAGREGGRIVFQGGPELLEAFRGKAPSVQRTARGLLPGLKITGACANNLDNVCLNIPSGGMIAVTGVSGSGKTSLISDVLWRSYSEKQPVNCKHIEWGRQFDQLVMVEQDAPPQPQTSVPAAFLGIFDAFRSLFAGSNMAKEAGLKASHFSFLSRDGRCPECGGAGSIPVSLDYWADARVTCHSCRGQRYLPEILNIRIGGLSIADILGQSLSSAREFASGQIASKERAGLLQTLDLAVKAGLGYLPLGQPLSTLSTGEMQRLKLAAGLAGASSRRCLFLLDEPTGGLHPRDIAGLLKLFDELTAAGGTVLCITHEPMVVSCADWLIGLGPGAGKSGGKVVYAGKPQDKAD
ncbi:ATP-binding cassette domain-containing protein [candidate division TA06 bacterium]|nr:ATP-binding cassette domain-containing protein [candidate division TA06 bacterium]